MLTFKLSNLTKDQCKKLCSEIKEGRIEDMWTEDFVVWHPVVPENYAATFCELLDSIGVDIK